MKKLLSVSLFSLVLFLSASASQASSPFDIQFPIPELGGCADQASCKSYCDDAAHIEACFEFAKKHGLAGKEESAGAKILKEVQQGPGGCQEEDECREYCNDSAHIDECLAFAEQYDLIDKEDAVRIRKQGLAAGPGGCKGEECRSYCENPANHVECIEFAENNGLMSREEAERARKFAGKTGPGGCRGNECGEFCKNPANAEQCLEFAAREGLIPPQELERARKFLRVSQEGGPGGCKGGQCRTYCEDSAHQDECFEFAKKQGFINPEDEKHFESGKKIRQKMQATGGPGGCKTEDECRAYCTDSSHVEECVAFGAAHGGLPEEEARRMIKEFQEHRFEIQANIGGEFHRTEDFRRFEEEARGRFEEFRQLEVHFRGNSPGAFPGRPEFGPPSEGGSSPGVGGSFVGPGGCTSPSECINYCATHKEECFSFGPPGQPGVRPPEGGIPPGREGAFPGPRQIPFGGPGAMPRLRTGIVQPIRPDDLPHDFERRSEEEKREFFKQKFQEFHGRPEDLPAGRQGFPGRPEQFPGQFPQEGNFPEGFRPDSGTFPLPPEGALREPTHVDQLFQPQSSGTVPPQGDVFNALPPTETFQPAESFLQPPPPPSTEPAPPPSSAAPFSSFFGAVLKAFSGTR